ASLDIGELYERKDKLCVLDRCLGGRGGNADLALVRGGRAMGRKALGDGGDAGPTRRRAGGTGAVLAIRQGPWGQGRSRSGSCLVQQGRRKGRPGRDAQHGLVLLER